jgi:predicted nucleotidyltransferase
MMVEMALRLPESLTRLTDGERDDPLEMTTSLATEPYVAYWRRRQVEGRARSLRLAQEARGDAARIAAMLRRDFGVTHVLLFGSLARGRFLPDSDIDLAVAGLPVTAFFTALAQAAKLSEFPVDLKPMEDLDVHFRDRVLATGEEI